MQNARAVRNKPISVVGDGGREVARVGLQTGNGGKWLEGQTHMNHITRGTNTT